MSRPKIFIPFRYREGDSLARSANLEIVWAWWWMWGFEPIIQSDELPGDWSFNRHRAFNLAVDKFPDESVYLFAEADMLVHPRQVVSASALAFSKPGLVIPFREYRDLTTEATNTLWDGMYDYSSERLSDWWALPPTDPRSIFTMNHLGSLVDGENVGSVFALSGRTYREVEGFPETVSGHWYDAQIFAKAVEILTGEPTRWVSGPAVHLSHPEDGRDSSVFGDDQRLWRMLKHAHLVGDSVDTEPLRKVMQSRINIEERGK